MLFNFFFSFNGILIIYYIFLNEKKNMFIPVNLIINSRPFEKTLMLLIVNVKFFGEKNKIIKTLF
jgi:hypothetical protein